MLIKIAILSLILGILIALGSALYFMLSRKSSPQLMAKALSWRIGLSIIMFLLLLLAFVSGWIHPHPL